jgi:hypothetical protein
LVERKFIRDMKGITFYRNHVDWMEISLHIFGLVAGITHRDIIPAELQLQIFVSRFRCYLMADITVFTGEVGIDYFLRGTNLNEGAISFRLRTCTSSY